MLAILCSRNSECTKSVYKWYKLFTEGREEVNDDARPGRPSMTIAQEMLNNVNDDPDLLKKVITGDESWVYGYDVETKAQSSQWTRSYG